MTEYTLMHIHVVKANSREEALDIFQKAINSGKTEDYYENFIVKKKQKPRTWLSEVKYQITGK